MLYVYVGVYIIYIHNALIVYIHVHISVFVYFERQDQPYNS